VLTAVGGGPVGGSVDERPTMDAHLHSQISRLSVFTVFLLELNEQMRLIEPWGFKENLTHLRVVVNGIFAPFFIVQCDFFIDIIICHIGLPCWKRLSTASR
jgi:hypothetical protein